MITDYSFLKNTRTADKWERIGMRRRAGVAVPLFSVRSSQSTGIGEIPDIKLIVKWCVKTGNTIIQLLPLNDTGFDFAPYNSVSSYALDPMYLSIQSLKEVNLNPFRESIRNLKRDYKNDSDSVNYKIKEDKLKLFYRIYKRSYLRGIRRYEKFVSDNLYWLKDYAVFKVLKESNCSDCWQDWNANFANREPSVLEQFSKENADKIHFHYWLQWQLYEQMTSVKKYAESKKVFIMGDLPFLVSRDSADVWSDRKYFKLNLSSGAPPDMYFAGGQRWGMPSYNREELEKDGFTYITNKLKYAENFYDLFRIDHFVGFFRLWTIDINESLETGGLNGKYDPAQENLWEETGRNLVEAIIKNTTMLPCAEDLGTVPECSGRVLWDYGIPGIDVQRWMKTRDGSFNFLEPQDYRWLAAATVSTHDSSTIPDWWHNEAGTIDGKLFERLMREKGFTDIRINEIKENLFDADASRYDRLYWKEEIDSNGKMLNALGIPQESAWNITVLYNESYGEKKKYMEYIGKFNPLRSAHLDDINESRTFSGNDNLKVADTANNCISTVTPEVMESVLGKINSSSSIFSIQLLQEWLSMDDKFLRAVQEKSYRINFPGIVSESNWATVLPYTLERIIDFEINSEILNLNREAIRV